MDPARARVTLALPRAVEADARAAAVHAALAAGAVLLWQRGTLIAARLSLAPALARALGTARAQRRLVVGLDAAASALAAERAGLDALVRRGTPVGGRVSRLLLVADDGTERFYRQVERVALAHAPRVLVVRCAADAVALGTAVLGRPRTVKAVLAAHRDAVAALLLALGDGG
jgi:hypothetical protein